MTDAKNVLVFPAGTEIALEINNALRYSKFVRLFGATSVPCHAEFVFETCIEGIPYPDSPDFIEKLNAVIDEYGIEYIYPAHDSVLLKLTQEREKLRAEVVTSELATVEITRSKNKTYAHLAGAAYLPKTYPDAAAVESFPVFVKPAVGQGAEGARRIDDRETLDRILSDGTEYAICEYLPGEEYTVDCFTDRHGELRAVCPRTRSRIRAGISVRSHRVDCTEEFSSIARDINRRFSFHGAWFFQLRKNAAGQLRLMEIAPRIAGTMSVTRNSGMNMPLLTLFDLWGYDVGILDNRRDILLDRAFISRFQTDIHYSNVFVDYDDTLYIGEKVNGLLMMFLYQAKAAGKKLILLTKHDTGDLLDSLDGFCISPKLFDEILHISRCESKEKYLVPDSIFIDDSYAERRKIAEACAVPVFDLDAVESLIDWRV